MALHAELRFGVRLFREPDAGNPPVRFDEREEETELGQTGLRRRGESRANRHREANVTAPLLDSTQNALGRGFLLTHRTAVMPRAGEVHFPATGCLPPWARSTHTRRP